MIQCNPQTMMTMKSPIATSSHSTLHPPITCTSSSKLAAELQPMDLDHMKSKNPPWICYNGSKPGHITCNCSEP